MKASAKAVAEIFEDRIEAEKAHGDQDTSAVHIGSVVSIAGIGCN